MDVTGVPSRCHGPLAHPCAIRDIPITPKRSSDQRFRAARSVLVVPRMFVRMAFGGALTCLVLACLAEAEGGYSGPRTTTCSTGAPYAHPPEVRNKPFDATLPECIPRCGAEQKYPGVGTMAFSIEALPSGSCTHEGEACRMAAGTTQQCPGEEKRACNYSGFECRCEGGRWNCSTISPGAGICGPCADAGR
jgi:hypothetical protein